MGFFSKLFSKENKESLDQGLAKTKESFFGKLAKAVAGKNSVDADVLDNLEENTQGNKLMKLRLLLLVW